MEKNGRMIFHLKINLPNTIVGKKLLNVLLNIIHLVGIIIHYSSSMFIIYILGKEESVKMTPRQLNKDYHLDTMFIGIRQVQLQPDGISYRADPNSSVIFSSQFIGGILIIK